ncbi:flagellar basal body-associated FliL family protein [Paenibacillus faecalis]|uniref:flagellar basal body-associated FliL family protein n=1 Tax=Paenibacillus faecalis TaxID=2079532 RepID=UPI000D10EC98|nr:flagellar basal body-associated FliL family protein [Paenibacillus faecalis]
MKKMLPWLVTIMLSITLIVLAVFLLSNKMLDKEEPTGVVAAPAPTPVLSADEVVEVTAEIKEVKTNLADPDYLGTMNFAFQLRDKKAKEDFDKIKEIKVKPIIIKALNDTKPESLKDSKATDQFLSKLFDEISKVLPNGQLVQIEITEKLVVPL